MDMQFQGQQTGERILYFSRSHTIIKTLSVFNILFFSILTFFIFQMLSVFAPVLQNGFKLLSLIVPVIFFIIGWWWVQVVYKKTLFYITDRRIVKFAHDDLANYIDKILFMYKNQPSELSTLRPFIAKPKGQRDS